MYISISLASLITTGKEKNWLIKTCFNKFLIVFPVHCFVNNLTGPLLALNNNETSLKMLIVFQLRKI